MHRTVVGLLVAVVAVLGVIAWALLRTDPQDSPERREAESRFREVAKVECIVEREGQTGDARYDSCVDRRVALALDRWDAKNG